jgi:DNA-binding GntR family transcriptional regulator
MLRTSTITVKRLPPAISCMATSTATKRGPLVMVKRQVLREEVREALISAILTGEFPPGDRIVESGVARALGVSQTTIREALREIEQCGTISP